MDEQLFIIGNGFDLAHGMPTRYTEFRQYLIEKQDDAKKSCLYDLLNFRIGGDEEWKKFEFSLGFLDFEDELDYYIEEIQNGYDDGYIAVTNMNTVIENCKETIDSLGDIFSEWVSTIEMPKVDKRLNNFYDLLRNHKNHFLSFNYTDTLEFLYQCDVVCHIHGSFAMEDELLVGHGELSHNIEYDLESGESLEEYAGPLHGTYDENLAIRKNFDSIHNTLKKDVDRASTKHKNFFSDLGNVTRIYSFGFSYGDVDLPYIRKIIQNINNASNVEWFLNNYDTEQNSEFENKIRACGFTGEFHRYSC